MVLEVTVPYEAPRPDPLPDPRRFEAGPYTPRSVESPAELTWQARIDGAMAGAELQIPFLMHGFDAPDFEPEPDYSPFVDDDIGDRPPEAFVESRSRAETQWLRERVDRERQARRQAAAAGGYGIAGEVVGAFANPILAIPLALPVRTLRGIVGVAAGSEATSELVLQRQQAERTLAETAINVGASTLLAGILGTVATRLSRPQYEAIREKVAADLRSPMFTAAELTEDPLRTGASAGAARVDEADPAAQSVADARLFGMRIPGTGEALRTLMIGPAARLLGSRSQEARNLTEKLVDLPVTLKKGEAGRTAGPSIESLELGEGEVLQFEFFRHFEAQYQAYRQRGGRLTSDDFSSRIGYAMRRSDKDLVHDRIPEVENVARLVRAKLFDPHRERMLAARLISDEDVEIASWTAETYLPRFFNADRLLDDQANAEWLLTEHLSKNLDDLGEAQLAAQEMVARWIGSGHFEESPRYYKRKTGSAQQRTLLVKDEIIEDFLVSDIREIVPRYLRSVLPQLALQQRFGSIGLTDELGKVRTEYARLISAAESPRAKTQLARQRDRDINDLIGLRDRILGTFGRPQNPNSALVQAGQMARTANTLSMLGGVTLSSLADLARPIATYGLLPFSKAMIALATDWRNLGMSKAEVQRMGIALDRYNAKRAVEISDVGDIRSRLQQRAINKLFTWSAFNAWNASMKSLAGTIGMDTLIGWTGRLARGQQLGKIERGKLSSIGISEDMARRIADEFEQHGAKDGILRIANHDLWDDREAAAVFAAAIRADVHRTIIKPGLGDTPLFLSSEMGKLIGQFKSFLIGAHNRMLISGLQKADSGFFLSLAAGVALGMLTTSVKNAARGRDNPQSWEAWVAEGVDRSGYAGLFSVPFRYLRLMAGDAPSRFAGRAIIGEALGPTFGQAENAAVAFSAAAQGEIDSERLWRMAPYQNLLHLREIAERLAE